MGHHQQWACIGTCHTLVDVGGEPQVKWATKPLHIRLEHHSMGSSAQLHASTGTSIVVVQGSHPERYRPVSLMRCGGGLCSCLETMSPQSHSKQACQLPLRHRCKDWQQACRDKVPRHCGVMHAGYMLLTLLTHATGPSILRQ